MFLLHVYIELRTQAVADVRLIIFFKSEFLTLLSSQTVGKFRYYCTPLKKVHHGKESYTSGPGSG